MTEAEWWACQEPMELMRALAHAPWPQRKARLVAVAYCRVLLTGLGRDSGSAPDVIARYADSGKTKAALKRVRKELRAARYALPHGEPETTRLWTAYWLMEVAGTENAVPMTAGAIRVLPDASTLNLTSDERRAAATIVRDIFGNQFHPVHFDPRWRTADVLDLTRAIYDDLAFERLPLLADALMDAGCADEAILAHCRSSGPHVRGCWVVDLALGKE
jgi:hypothetical protein